MKDGKEIIFDMHSDNKGISLVEILCAVAIFSLIAATISSIVVVSTRTYGKGVTETSMQQEAQLAANRIGELVKDANNATSTDASGSTGGTLTLRINDTQGYCISHDYANKKLIYNTVTYTPDTADPDDRSKDIATVGSENAELAENITDFSADVDSDFEKNRIVRISFDVTQNGKTYTMNYAMTARNEVVEAIDTDYEFISVSYDNNIIMEPGQTYDLHIATSGDTGGIDFSYSDTEVSLPATSYPASESFSVPITIKNNATSDHVDIDVRTGAEVTGTTTPKWKGTIRIYIRRTNSINVSYVVDTRGTAGSKESEGAKYTFYAVVDDQNGTKNASASATWDSNYYNTKPVDWRIDVELNGTAVTDTAEIDKLYEIVSKDETSNKPKLEIKLKKNMPAGLKLTVTATSLHQMGKRAAVQTNKTGVMYCNTAGNLEPISGSAVIEPRETKVNTNLEITLEPNETGSVALGMKGGIVSESDVRCVLRGNGDENTIATYVASSDRVKDSVKITLGEDEHGEDKGFSKTLNCEEYSYTFYVDVYLGTDTVPKTTVTVHVCRIDTLSIYVQDNFFPEQKYNDDKTLKDTLNTPTYDFRARFNVGNRNIDSMKAYSLYTYKDYVEKADKGDGTYDTAELERIKNNLSAEISWKLTGSDGNVIEYDVYDEYNRKTGTVKCEGTVTCPAAVTKEKKESKVENGKTVEKTVEENILGESSITVSANTKYYSIVNVKPARVVKKLDGTWEIKQVPEIDISPSTSGETSGLPKGSTLTVTIKALHPEGKNKTGTSYGTAKDSASISGDQTVEFDTDYVIAEPGQGTDSKAKVEGEADKELAIPVYVAGGAAYTMKAELIGAGSSKTRLSVYKKESGEEDKDDLGNMNPYRDTSGGSYGNHLWWVGLVIGADETGRYDEATGGVSDKATGCIQLTVTAYSKKTVIDTKSIKIRIRRVNDVDLKVIRNVDGSETIDKNIDAVNSANQTVTISAYPTGYGNTGVEYYRIQTKDNNPDGEVCRWETANHGEYKSPYRMKWTMEINNVEKPLEQWTDYIEEGSVVVYHAKGNQAGEADLKESDRLGSFVDFKLKQPLPTGTVIKATSLHALGASGGTNYNKSGTKYGDVVGKITIGSGDEGGSDAIKGAIQRGTSSNLSEYLNFAGKTNDVNGITQTLFFRYREESSSTWSQYYRMIDGDSCNNAWLRQNESLLFLPDKAYYVDVIFVRFGNKKIYYPQDSDLITDTTTGWAKAGYSLSGGTATPVSEYKRTFYVGKTKITLNPNEVSLNTGGSKDIKLSATDFSLGDKQSYFKADIQKWDGNNWVSALVRDNSVYENSTDNDNNKVWHLQTECPTYRIDNVTSLAKGSKYRLGVTLKGMEWTTPPSGYTLPNKINENDYSKEAKDYNLYNWSTGEGVLNIEFNN
jgi:type II secretory pathway pseudopilin PulG